MEEWLPDEAVMRVMSFNVRGAYWQEDGINYWPHRAALNVATIRRVAPDLIGFQELQDGNLRYYQEALPEYRWSLGPHYGNRAPYEYPAIAWNPARYRLVAAGGFYLSETPLVHSASWSTACIRSAQWLRFQPYPGGAPFTLLNTHLDHVSEQACVEGAGLICRNGLELLGPLIITGDFNCDPGSPAYEVFRLQGFVDSYRIALPNQHDLYTYHGFVGREYTLKPGRSERIDWILVRGMEVIGAEIIRDEAPPIYPSDHYPVFAELNDFFV
jgi:endonuclease/exonuclease/phosphatase family metal-dependent hydrolase